jgi:uncharacterized protein GlcG (DUF336 family)
MVSEVKKYWALSGIASWTGCVTNRQGLIVFASRPTNILWWRVKQLCTNERRGGVPIVMNGQCVDAVGVSGVKTDKDERVAMAACDALKSSIGSLTSKI